MKPSTFLMTRKLTYMCEICGMPLEINIAKKKIYIYILLCLFLDFVFPLTHFELQISQPNKKEGHISIRLITSGRPT